MALNVLAGKPGHPQHSPECVHGVGYAIRIDG